MDKLQTLHFDEYRTGTLDLSVRYDTRATPSPLTTHMHDFFEIVYIKKGSGLHQINDIFYPMLTGDIYIMAPGDTHSATIDKSWEIVNILFQSTLFPEKEWNYLKNLPGLSVLNNAHKKDDLHKLALSPTHADYITGLYLKIKSECQQKESGWEASARNAFAEILITISRAWITYGNQKLQTHLSQGPISKALQIIYENWDKEISVSDLAKQVHLSKNYFGEMFQREVGMTVQQYINKLKIDHARILLEDKTLSINAISDTIGYQDANYFSRVFKKVYNMTPKEYRSVMAKQ